MRALVEVSVAYEEDLDKVMEVLNRVCEDVAAEVETIREGPRPLGVSKLGESEVGILIWARTEPMAQWSVEREIRRRVKRAFEVEGIEIPYARRVIVPASNTKAGMSYHQKNRVDPSKAVSQDDTALQSG